MKNGNYSASNLDIMSTYQGFLESYRLDGMMKDSGPSDSEACHLMPRVSLFYPG